MRICPKILKIVAHSYFRAASLAVAIVWSKNQVKKVYMLILSAKGAK
jgi:hypothetical protein